MAYLKPTLGMRVAFLPALRTMPDLAKLQGKTGTVVRISATSDVFVKLDDGGAEVMTKVSRLEEVESE